jgi:hypothetical protein
LGNLREREYLEDVDVAGMIMLNGSSRNRFGEVYWIDMAYYRE